MDPKDISDVVTAIVAVAGLILSVYNLYASRRDKSPRLISKMSNGFLTSGPEVSSPMLFLEIANAGEKEVKISAVEVAIGKHRVISFGGITGTKNVPFELPPGESVKFWIPLEEFATSLRKQNVYGNIKARACFRDAIGNEYLSKKFPIRLDAWAQRITPI